MSEEAIVKSLLASAFRMWKHFRDFHGEEEEAIQMDHVIHSEQSTKLRKYPLWENETSKSPLYLSPVDED